MRVLIPLEMMSSESAVLNAAVARPWPSGTIFCLLHVVVPRYPPMLIPRLFENVKTTILHRLDRAAQSLKKAGWNVRTEVLEGSSRRTINRFAKEWHADLIMIGSDDDRGPLARLCLGSTAQSVMRHAPCSVEIVRPPKDGRPGHGGVRILAATDGSEFSTAALRSVAARPWPEGSKLKVISAPEFVLTKDDSYLENHSRKEFVDLGTASIEDAKRCIATAQEILAGCPLTVNAEVPEYEDRPYQVILREAEEWQADLIVVGSHGRSGFDRVVMGSVSEAVALHAKCSVEIIRDAESTVDEHRRAA